MQGLLDIIGTTTNTFAHHADVFFRLLGDGSVEDDLRPNIAVYQGGSSSGKTQSDLQIAIMLAFMDAGSITTVAGKSIPNLKQGAVQDMRRIIRNSPYLQKHTRENLVDRTWFFSNGSIINMDSFPDVDKAHGPRRDYLIANEAYFIPKQIFDGLADRTRKKIIVEFNPLARFWAHDIVARGEGIPCVTTYKDNQYCPPATRRRLERYAETDPARHRVYTLGQIGRVEGLVFNWAVTPIPDGAKLVGYGLDFGYEPDPTTLVAVYQRGRELWLHELLYQTELFPSQVAQKLKELCEKNVMIYADSASKGAIAEIRSYGLPIMPVKKGEGSILEGIYLMKDYELNITPESENFADELSAYFWPRDKNDNQIPGNPLGKEDHLIDAARYCISMTLANKHASGPPVPRQNTRHTGF